MFVSRLPTPRGLCWVDLGGGILEAAVQGNRIEYYAIALTAALNEFQCS